MTRSLNSLEQHALAFGRQKKDGSIVTSSASIDQTVEKHCGKKCFSVVGQAVNFFNNTFVGKHCPVGETVFSGKTGRTDFGPNLHEGTFRIFNRDGSINEERIAVFRRIADVNGRVALSVLIDALKKQIKENIKEAGTGRDGGCVTGPIEAIAIEVAWAQIFDLLVCAWQPHPKKSQELEPLVEATMLESFFKENPICLKKAIELGLPVPKPEIEKTFCCC